MHFVDLDLIHSIIEMMIEMMMILYLLLNWFEQAFLTLDFHEFYSPSSALLVIAL